MTTTTEEPASAQQLEDCRTAFGLALSIDPRLSIPGLGDPGGAASASPPTRVHLDAGELDRRWGALPTAPHRAREIYFGETLLLSVDFAEPAGYLLWARSSGAC